MFAVFGKSRIKAKTEAEKIVEAINPQTHHQYSLEEYTEKLEQVTDEIYKKMRSSRLSPEYESRKVAREYLLRTKEAGTAEKLIIKQRDEEGKWAKK